MCVCVCRRARACVREIGRSKFEAFQRRGRSEALHKSSPSPTRGYHTAGKLGVILH